MITVTAPDGSTVDFPDGTDAGTIDKVMRENFKPAGEKRPSGAAAGFMQGLSNLAGGHAATDKAFLDAESPTLDTIAKKTSVKDYVPANVFQGTIDPRKWQFSQMPQAIAEAAPGLTTDIGAAMAAGKVTPGGAKAKAAASILAAAGSAWHRNAGNTADEAAKNAGREKPNAEDLTRAGLTEAASSVVGSLPITRLIPGANKIGTVGLEGAKDSVAKYATTIGTSAAGAGAADAVHQAGLTVGTDKGIQYNPEQGINSALTGGMMGAAAAGPRAAADLMRSRSYRDFGGDNKDATGALAKRMADTDNALGTARGDYDTITRVKADLSSELGDAAANVRRQTALSADAENAIEAARAGKPVTQKDVELIARETAGTPDGDNVTHLARQAFLTQELMKKGSLRASDKAWAGGVSGKMDKLISNLGGKAAVGGAASLLGLNLLGTSSPLYAGAAVGTYGLARMVDGLTGQRSPANTFVQHFNDLNARTRLPAAQQQSPPQAPTPAPNQPWGPIPPAAGPTGPRVAPPGAPQPAPGTMGPWGPKPLPTTSGVPNVSPPAAPPPKAPWAAPHIAEAPLDLPPEFVAMLKASKVAPEALPPEFSAMLGKSMPAPPAPPAPAPQAPPVTELPKGFSAMLKAAQAPPEVIPAAFSKMLGRDAPPQNPVSPAAPAAAPVAPPAAAAPANQVTSIADILSNVEAVQAAPKKITKKDGKVEASAPALEGLNPAAPPSDFYRAIPPEDMRYKGKSVVEIARAIANDRMADKPASVREQYFNSVLDTHTQRRQIVENIIAKNPKDAQVLNDLIDQLHERGDRAKAVAAIKQTRGLLSPKAAKALDAGFNEKALGDIWPEKKAKKKASGTKAKGRKSSKAAGDAEVQILAAE